MSPIMDDSIADSMSDMESGVKKDEYGNLIDDGRKVSDSNNEEIIPLLVHNEDRWVARSKILVILVISLTALAICIGVFKYSQATEDHDFEVRVRKYTYIYRYI